MNRAYQQKSAEQLRQIFLNVNDSMSSLRKLIEEIQHRSDQEINYILKGIEAGKYTKANELKGSGAKILQSKNFPIVHPNIKLRYS